MDFLAPIELNNEGALFEPSIRYWSVNFPRDGYQHHRPDSQRHYILAMRDVDLPMPVSCVSSSPIAPNPGSWRSCGYVLALSRTLRVSLYGIKGLGEIDVRWITVVRNCTAPIKGGVCSSWLILEMRAEAFRLISMPTAAASKRMRIGYGVGLEAYEILRRQNGIVGRPDPFLWRCKTVMAA